MNESSIEKQVRDDTDAAIKKMQLAFAKWFRWQFKREPVVYWTTSLAWAPENGAPNYASDTFCWLAWVNGRCHVEPEMRRTAGRAMEMTP